MVIIKVCNVNLGHNKGYCLTFCSQKFLMTDLGLWGASGISICVPLTSFFPLYPMSPASLPTFFPVMRSTCKSDSSMVCPSYSFRKDLAPRIIPVIERMIETLFPNSYFLCSLPLLMHCTSGSCREGCVSIPWQSFPQWCAAACPPSRLWRGSSDGCGSVGLGKSF